jgi:hypothetical protein
VLLLQGNGGLEPSAPATIVSTAITQPSATTDSHPPSVVVPDLTGISQSQAEEELQRMGRWLSDRMDTVASRSIAAGDVVRTLPQAGAQVEYGSEVTLMLSRGTECLPGVNPPAEFNRSVVCGGELSWPTTNTTFATSRCPAPWTLTCCCPASTGILPGAAVTAQNAPEGAVLPATPARRPCRARHLPRPRPNRGGQTRRSDSTGGSQPARNARDRNQGLRRQTPSRRTHHP